MDTARLRGFFPRHLQVQVGFIVSLLLIASIALYAWYTAGTQAANGSAAIKNQVYIITKNFADLSVNYLLTEDVASLETFVVKLAEFPHVLSIEVCNRDGLVLSKAVREGNAAPRVLYNVGPLHPPADTRPVITFGGDRIVAWNPVIAGSLLGWVKIEYSMEEIGELKRRIWRDSFVAGIPAVTAGIFLILFFLGRPIRAIRRTTAFAQRLDMLTGETIPRERTSLEIEQLIDTLNHTSVKLYEQDRSLKDAAERLERLRHQNLLILQSAGEGIIGLDTGGKHTFVNAAAEYFLDWQAGELIGRSGHETWHPGGPDGALFAAEDCRICALFRDGRVHHVDGEAFRRKDGTSFPVEYTMTPILEGDSATGAVVTFRDITERRRTEEALRQSENKYRTLFEESKDVVFINTPQGKVVDINPAGIDLFGFSSKDELLKADMGRDLCVNLRDWEVFSDIMEQKGFVKDHEIALRKKSGELLVILITATAVRDAGGAVTAHRGILRDVTSERKLEDQLRHAQKMEAVGQLTGGIAHDFNNFLTAIIGFGYLLQMKLKKGDPLRHHAEQILVAAERASGLTRNLLVFSSRQETNARPVRINDIVKRVKSLLSKLIGENIELTMRLAEEELTVMADSGQVEQVLMNLAANARDAMPDGGALTVESSTVHLDGEFVSMHGYGQQGEYVLLSVSDTGTGMDAATIKRIFEPFFTTKEEGKGTGLGLSIVYGIVKQHGGYINVYSEPGKGTTFKLYLPLIKAVVEEAQAQDLAPHRGGSETVLMAEDDAEVRKLTRTVLGEFGYSVIEASDGEEALAKFLPNKDAVSLLLLDVIMPKKNGREVYEEAKALKPGIKVLFTSGYSAGFIRQKGILEDGLDFVSKPVSPTALLRRVREVLDK